MLRLLAPLVTALLSMALPAAAQQPVPAGLEAVMPDDPGGRLAHILQRGTLIVGVKDDYPPWGMRDREGAIVGLEIDLARDLADRMGVALAVEPVTASNRIGRVNQGQVDVVIATTGDTVERRAQVDVLLPNYYSSGVVVYARSDTPLRGWAALEGEKICLNSGAFYNRALEENLGIDGQYFASNRDSRLALQRGRCVGWAFDDTALAQLIRAEREAATAGQGDTPAYSVITEAILVSPWAILVAQGEGKGDLGRFVTDMIGEWHASGRILELQDKWNLPRTDYIEDLHAIWSRTEDGRALCARDPTTGAHPAECLRSDPVESVSEAPPPEWIENLRVLTGIDLSAVVTPYNRERLLRALGLTLSLSAIAIVGALTIGTVLALLQTALGGLGILGKLLLLPQRLLVTVARMTPPILQLYIVFFGLGGILGNPGGFTPGSFVIAAAILSLYAGATNTIILAHALEAEPETEKSLMARLPGAFLRAYDGLVATCVNIVKAAGLASAIAVAELVSTVDLMVSEGADTATLMNGLLVFYFFLVLFILWLFQALRQRLERP